MRSYFLSTDHSRLSHISKLTTTQGRVFILLESYPIYTYIYFMNHKEIRLFPQEPEFQDIIFTNFNKISASAINPNLDNVGFCIILVQLTFRNTFSLLSSDPKCDDTGWNTTLKSKWISLLTLFVTLT